MTIFAYRSSSYLFYGGQHTETEETLLVGEHDPARHQSRILHLINKNKLLEKKECSGNTEWKTLLLADSSAA